MKNIAIASIVMLALFAFGCAEQTTEPTAVNAAKPVVASLDKTSAALEFGPLDFVPGDYSGVWPASDSNLVIWYFGGQAGEDGFPQDFIAGNASLSFDSLESSAVAEITIKKRGEGNPLLAVYADNIGGTPLDELSATEDFVVESFTVPAGTTKLVFVFGLGDINLDGGHIEVNFDLRHVSINLAEGE